MEDNTSPQLTPEASFDGIATTIIIPETEEKSNPSDENSSKKSSKGQLALPLEEVDGHSAAAQREFGTTTDFAQAGFVLQDGRMLKLSQYGRRGVQHKIIERVFDDARGSDAVNRFIQEGNIRIKAESQGIEIGTEKAPTVSQLNTVSRFISSSLRGKGYLYLDITDKNGNDVASVMYTERDSTSGVISDIKDYYARGRMPVPYDDMRYSIDLDGAGEMGYNYTEEQYEHFGWARHAEAITKNELDDLNSKLQEKKILRRFRQSARGEAIVEVNDKPHTTLGVDNVFAFVKGSATDPQITRVLRVSLFSETDMEKVRKFIYDNERRAHARTSVAVGNFFFEKGLFTEFTRKDFGSYQEYRAEIGKRSVRSESEGDQAYDRSRYERERHLRRSEDDVVYSLPLEDLDSNDGQGSEAYSYEALTSKPDLTVVELPDSVPMKDGAVDKKAVVARGRINARKQKNPNNTDTNTYVYVNDIGLDVLLGAKGLQHGLARSEETVLAVMKIGDVLKNSVAVNEMGGSLTRNTEMSYVLLGACQDGGKVYAVRSVVSKLQNDIKEIDVYQLAAVKGKKTETPNSALKRGAAVAEQGSLISSGSPNISISGFLQAVKDIPMINEVFSADVAEKLGVERSKGSLSKDLRYSLPLEDLTPAEEQAQEERQRDIPRKKRAKKDVPNEIKSIFTIQSSYDVLRSIRGMQDFSPNSIKAVCNKIWQGLSETRSADERRALAQNTSRYVLDWLMSAELYETSPEAKTAMEELAYLRTGIGRLTFSDTDVDELTHAFDKKGMSRIRGRWGYKGRGMFCALILDNILTTFCVSKADIEATKKRDKDIFKMQNDRFPSLA